MKNALTKLDPRVLTTAFLAAVERRERARDISGEDQSYLAMIRHFIGTVGKTEFGKSFYLVQEATTVEWAEQAYTKGLRTHDAFSVGKGHLDALLWNLIQQPYSTPFWDVFREIVFPKDKTVHYQAPEVTQ